MKRNFTVLTLVLSFAVFSILGLTGCPLFGGDGLPSVNASPSSLNFGLTETEKQITVRNIGYGTLHWSATIITPSSAWVSMIPESGSDAGIIVVSVNRSLMTTGLNQAKVRIKADSANEVLVDVLAEKSNPVEEGENEGAVEGEGESVPDQTATPDIEPSTVSGQEFYEITLSCPTSGATIRYTTNGTTPTESSLLYGSPFTVNGTPDTPATVNAKAFKISWTASAMASRSYTFTGTLATPDISPLVASGQESYEITLSCATSGAIIRYTTNGTTPTEISSLYSGPFTLSGTPDTPATINAKAFKAGWTPSAMASRSYTFTGTLAMPGIEPLTTGGQESYEVTLSCATPGASIRYTTNGSTPTESAPLYGSPFTLSGTPDTPATVNAKAFKTGWTASTMASRSYTFTGTLATPVIEPSTVSGQESYEITLSCATPGASIRYTTNGTTPTESSSLYRGAFTLSGTPDTPATVNAKAFKAGWTPSTMASRSYTFTGTLATPSIEPLTTGGQESYEITLSCTTPGAAIRYTTNGTTPTESSPLYGGPFTVNGTPDTPATVNAKAFKAGWTASVMASRSYTFTFVETIMLPGNVPIEIVWIPAGTFMMGRYSGEGDSERAEDPQHSVTLKGFWICKYELTQAQWFAVMGTTPWSGKEDVLDDEDSPAVYVSRDDAQMFITTLNSYAGLTFRLPSEAEWEYACRAGTTTRFYWGNDPGYTEIGDYAWYGGNSGYMIHPVGEKTANNFGLYDMSGNIWEWCEDDWHDNYTGAPTNGNAWVDSPRGSYCVVRGGSWDGYDFRCRSAYRTYTSPWRTTSFFGFRLAITLIEPTTPSVTSFTINDSETTTARTVTLNNTCTDSPTQYMASESSSFNDASWQIYSTAPSFTITSSGNGLKTVYFKVKNAVSESSSTSDTITLNEPAETIILPGNVPLDMVWIPSGTFMMGRYSGEQDSHASEDPQHLVTVSSGFWMGKYEVTQAQWKAVMNGANPSYFQGAHAGNVNTDNHPVESVSWNDIQTFITALNTLTDKTFRLPSEAEWEYACRAGKTTRFYWGDDLSNMDIGNYAWYGSNIGGMTHPVGEKTANNFGLYDMSGNVWEWCQDWSHDHYTGAPTDGSAWESPTGLYRVIRGGNWGNNDGADCRSARRANFDPWYGYTGLGFRLSR